ncbi:NAD(P)H-binding protein [Phycicoccus endophyticus]|uniref:NAD(P)H-binding protein n=1 Tax=Phycicoccus endophyticus TaxID=1690220 RepID=A0A7G9R3C1_9MICO|nr:NAD(P)H-binding protein [Phycicoccus endophyticus]NHI19844.1 NAD(P)H-binding protein [Phycicoccus endophyticus]QNN50096.1 NAD(P)H-binding protein [Phycicoccus endophyticus]GGL28120.1 nucleotide-diphosphate-sugar epimerase [Phycicoccus endophyticus]
MIVVTAPTSQIGGEVLRRLLQGAEQVRVVVRDPARLPEEVRSRVEVVQGSHADPAVVERAFDGADALFWLVPAAPAAPTIFDAYMGFALPAADAIRRHQVSRVVSVSALGAGVQTFAGHVSATLAMDALIRSTGANTRELANPSFMDNMLRDAASIRDRGVFTGTLPADLALPTVATRDIGAAAATFLVDQTWTGQEIVPLLGAEDLSPNDQAKILTEVLGAPIRYEQGDREASKRRLMGFGMSEAVAGALMAMDEAKEHGLDTAVPRTAANTTPTTFRQWATEVLKPAVEGAGR